MLCKPAAGNGGHKMSRYSWFTVYVQNFADGKISRTAFWELAKFKKPTHQISFHTARALTALSFVKGSEVRDEE